MGLTAVWVLTLIMTIVMALIGGAAYVQELRAGIAITGSSARDAKLISARTEVPLIPAFITGKQRNRESKPTLMVTTVNVGSVERVFLVTVLESSYCGTRRRLGALFGVLDETAGNPILLSIVPLPTDVSKQGTDEALVQRIVTAISRLTGRPIAVGQLQTDAIPRVTVAGPLDLDGQVVAERMHPYDPSFAGTDRWSRAAAAPLSPFPVAPVAFAAGAIPPPAHSSDHYPLPLHGGGDGAGGPPPASDSKKDVYPSSSFPVPAAPTPYVPHGGGEGVVAL
jgi:hypothetical protein